MKRLILLNFALLYFSSLGTAQEREPFKILVEAKIGALIAEHEDYYLGTHNEAYRFKNRDIIASIKGGVFITKSTIGGIGFRFDRIQRNVYHNDSNELRKKHRLYAGGIMLFLQQNFRLHRRNSIKKKLNGFARVYVSSLNFGEIKIFDRDGIRLSPEGFGSNFIETNQQFTTSFDLGLTYKLNEKTALLCQGTWEKSIDDSILSVLISDINIQRQFIHYYFVQVGVQRTISF